LWTFLIFYFKSSAQNNDNNTVGDGCHLPRWENGNKLFLLLKLTANIHQPENIWPVGTNEMQEGA